MVIAVKGKKEEDVMSRLKTANCVRQNYAKRITPGSVYVVAADCRSSTHSLRQASLL